MRRRRTTTAATTWTGRVCSQIVSVRKEYNLEPWWLMMLMKMKIVK